MNYVTTFKRDRYDTVSTQELWTRRKNFRLIKFVSFTYEKILKQKHGSSLARLKDKYG